MKSRILILFLALAVLPLTGRISFAGNVPVDGGTTITTGGTSQVVFAANENRRYLEIQNTSDTTMYLDFGQAATNTGTKSFELVPKAIYIHASNWCPTTTVTILCATTGKTFVAKQGP